VGAAILGGVSGALIVDDPIFDGALNNASSTFPLVMPLLAAGFVVQISRVISSNAQGMQAMTKPPSLLSILWKQAPDPAPSVRSIDTVLVPAPVMQTQGHSEPAHELAPLAVMAIAPAVEAAPPPQKPIPMPANSGGEHRVIMALGFFLILSGSVAYYMLNVYEPTVPKNFITYACKQPAISISYMPEANEILFASAKGVLKTTVIDNRILWDDYRKAGAKLEIPPPVKIVSVDARKLVVNGGMFENTTCYPSVQP
jgi:hypothetical protein